MIDEVRGFLGVALGPAPPSLTALAEALDRLALVQHSTPKGRPADIDEDPPAQNFTALYDTVAERFSELGLYPVADPVAEIPCEAMAGDGLDDVADIACDLSEVLWRWENRGADDARWYFQLLYGVHWGVHLHELRRYLHGLMFG